MGIIDRKGKERGKRCRPCMEGMHAACDGCDCHLCGALKALAEQVRESAALIFPLEVDPRPDRNE